MHFNKKYFIAFIIIFLIEVAIALWVHDAFVRPYIGDILVMILMYTFIRIFLPNKLKLLPVYLFSFATAIEMLQYLKIVERFNINNKVIVTIIGTTFDFADIICYVIGALLLLIWERWIVNNKLKKH